MSRSSSGRPRQGHLSTLVACLFGAGWLLRQSHADTYDIGVKLFTDPNCLFKAQDFLLLDGGCYANKWAPNATKGYRMNIVYFNSPERIDMRDFADDCHTLAMPKRTMTAGKDVCNPFLGSMYAQFDIRFRSNTCQGDMCSNLAIAVQTFYKQYGCSGPAHAIFRFPVQGECLRAMNGTQKLLASGDDSNISLVDYSGGDDCNPGRDIRVRDYSINNQYCYPLYTAEPPRSFSWRVERNTPYKAASDGCRSLPGLFTFMALVAGLRGIERCC